MDSQATALCQMENEAVIETLRPPVWGYITADPTGANVRETVWFPQYDDSGNLTADGHYSCTYDPENRLTEVQNPNPPTPDALAQAVDSGLAFTTRGLGFWQRQTGSPSYHDGDWTVTGAPPAPQTWAQVERKLKDLCEM